MPLYVLLLLFVGSRAMVEVGVLERVVPRRFFSSYQFEALVASLLDSMAVERSPVY